jgi:hypothetical protein
LNIKAGHRESDEEKVARYINGLKYEIQEEVIIMTMGMMGYYYQSELKEEEKLARKQSQRNKGKSPSRGKGTFQENFQKPKPEARKYHSHTKGGGSSRGGQYGGRKYFSQGRGRGRGVEVKCYAYGNTWHMSWECLERKNKEGGREGDIYEYQRMNFEATTVEYGKSIMMRKVLLNPEKEEKDPVQRNNLFRSPCKKKYRVCKVIIYSGSTNNLVSTEMVEKLELEKTAHPNPYKLSWL